jgi:hypothetical protein
MPTSAISQSLFSCGCQAAAVRLVVAGTQYIADFTGHLTVGVDPNQLAQYMRGATNLVELLVQEHVSNGVGAVIGAISLIHHPSRPAPPSTLRPITPGKPFPGIQDMIVDILVEIPALLPRIRLQPIIPWNPGPPILRNSNVTNFPPQNDVYQLVEPIELEDINNPGPVLATILNFPVTVNPPTA